MNIHVSRRALLAACLSAATCLILASPATAADRTPQAKQVVTMLAKRDFKGVVKGFDDTMAKALPAEKLAQVWDQLNAQAGPFKKQLGSRTDKVTQQGQQYAVVFVTCQFEKGNLDTQVVYNTAGKVSGLFFKPAQ